MSPWHLEEAQSAFLEHLDGLSIQVQVAEPSDYLRLPSRDGWRIVALIEHPGDAQSIAAFAVLGSSALVLQGIAPIAH